MSDWLEMTRRRCLVLIVGFVAALSGAWPGVSSGLAVSSREAEAARWRRQLRSPESAAIVGRAYLGAVAQSESDLVANLAASVGRPSASLSDSELGRRLRGRIRTDYSEDRTVLLNGWTLSRTEAQLCALYAL